jgi:diguanylate cyclase
VNKQSKIVRITTAISLVLAVAITFIMPLGYFVTSYVHITGTLKAEAQINSRIVSTIINSNPDLWRFEQLRLDELLALRPPGGEEEIRRIFDLGGQKVAESFTPLRPPLIKATHDLKAAGETVGWIEISRSLFPLLMNTGAITFLGLCIGLAVYVILRVLPLRAVFRAEEELRDLNESLERKIEERTRQLIKTQEELINSEKLALLGLIAGGDGK